MLASQSFHKVIFFGERGRIGWGTPSEPLLFCLVYYKSLVTALTSMKHSYFSDINQFIDLQQEFAKFSHRSHILLVH